MQRTWTLLEKEGEQSIFVVFRSWYGNKSFIHEQKISYEPNNPDCTALAVEIDPDTGEETFVVEEPTTITTDTGEEITTDTGDTEETVTETEEETPAEQEPEDTGVTEVEEPEVVEEVPQDSNVIAYQDPEQLVDLYLSNGRIVRLNDTNNYRYVNDRNLAYNFDRDFSVPCMAWALPASWVYRLKTQFCSCVQKVPPEDETFLFIPSRASRTLVSTSPCTVTFSFTDVFPQA